jgi:hypothetical protein
MERGAIDMETNRLAVLLGSGERRRPYLEQEEQERMEWEVGDGLVADRTVACTTTTTWPHLRS